MAILRFILFYVAVRHPFLTGNWTEIETLMLQSNKNIILPQNMRVACWFPAATISELVCVVTKQQPLRL